MKHPNLLDSLESIRSNREYVELNDLCKLFNAIQIESRLGFSVVSLVREAITCVRFGWGKRGSSILSEFIFLICFPHTFVLIP